MTSYDPRLEAIKREYKQRIREHLEEQGETVTDYDIESLMESNTARKRFQEARRYIEEGRRTMNEVRLWGKTLGIFGRR